MPDTIPSSAHAQLAAIRGVLVERARLQQAALAAAAEAERLAHAERTLFARTVGAVRPLRLQRLALIERERALPRARQRELDEQAVMREAISDDFDVESLLDTDDALSYRRPGVGLDVVRRLRRGQWSLQGQIDLHGLRTDEARAALSQFVREAHKVGWRCVRVVHGKGLGSPGKTPVLKNKVQRWLVQKNEVLAFVQAKPSDGGAGALVVLLTPG
ncbi:MAG: Smr/MutS family protein [Burkholderiaceae bacterium]|nr:Smr/MutS family protein [Burkholderiaceae bacterium]MDZ4163242.1 Smr/MutS family protein [Burkholderiales bacterium]